MKLLRHIQSGAASSFFFLCLSASAFAEETDKGGLPQLDTRLFPEQLFWLAVTFAVLYLLMAGFALPRVARTQLNRRSVIATEIETARVASQAARATMAALENSLNQARAKAKTDVNVMVAAVARESLVKQAAQEKELQRVLYRAEEEIAVARAAALKSIEASATDLAAVIVDKVLGFKMKGGA